MLIGIPHYNDFKGLKLCIKSLIKSANISGNQLIILNSDEKVISKIELFLSNLPTGFQIELINTPKYGPLDAYNRLFEIAKERKQDLFLTQTDVYFPLAKKDWLDECKAIALLNNCGAITCWGGGGISGPDFINGFNWIGAWFIYIPYRTIEKIGGYDLNIPLGYGVDIDYTYAILNAGLNLYKVDYWIQHMPDYDNRHEHEKCEDFEILKRDAFIYMRRKWKVGEYVK